MDAIDINYKLAKKGISQTNLARSLGVSVVAVHRVIAGEISSYNIASYIAQRLDQPITKLWPGRYDKRAA
ncbi:MAG: helix-turn-helix domain-containing protein [Arenicellales bacterium]